MIRAIRRRLTQLLRSLLWRADSDDLGAQAEQDTDQADAESGSDGDSQDAGKPTGDAATGDGPDTADDPVVADDTAKIDSGDTETPDVNRSTDESIDVEWPPFVGDDTIPWPERPEDPTNTIEVRLYWPASDPWVERACRQSKPYVRYCLLDAFADQGYDVDVQIHPDPIPADVDDFSEWSEDLPEMAKDANVALARYGPEYGLAGGYWAWVQPFFFKDWGREPADPIKNVGGDGSFTGPTAGVVTILHEIGHCLGLGHLDRVGNEVTKWGQDRTTPLNAGYENVTRTRYVYEYHPSIKDRKPKVQPPEG
jgi:hypothetical protein